MFNAIRKPSAAARTFRRYALLWIFLVFIAGTFSNWIFHLLYEQSILDKNHWVGYINAAVFATFYQLSFHITFHGAIKRFPPFNLKNGFVHVGAGIVNVVFGMLSGWLVMPLIMMLLEHSEVKEKMALEFGIILLIMLCCAFVQSGIFYIDWYVKEQSKADQARVNSELSALRAQINPHFLFNAMNTIAALVRKDANRAEEVVLDLADVFRYILQSSKKSLVPLSEELDLVRMFLNIEKARFGEKLTVEIRHSPETDKMLIPSLLLQPLVENAIKHSVSKVQESVLLTIEAKMEAGKLRLFVGDSGPGFSENDVAKYLDKGTGLTNVKRLLELSFPGKHSIQIKNRGLEIELNLDSGKTA